MAQANDELRPPRCGLDDLAPRLRTMALPANTRVFFGKSMLGAFRQGDVLVFDESSFSDVVVGDVVAYRPLEAGEDSNEIVHRVIAVEDEGLRMQGDSNRFPDHDLVTVQSFAGRIGYRERSGNRRRVASGRTGLFRARSFAWFRRSSLRILRIGGWPYRSLREGGVLTRFWRPEIREFRFRCGDGEIIRLMHRDRIVGEWRSGGRNIRWKKPYDLVCSRWRVAQDGNGRTMVVRR